MRFEHYVIVEFDKLYLSIMVEFMSSLDLHEFMVEFDKLYLSIM